MLIIAVAFLVLLVVVAPLAVMRGRRCGFCHGTGLYQSDFPQESRRCLVCGGKRYL